MTDYLHLKRYFTHIYKKDKTNITQNNSKNTKYKTDYVGTKN